LLVIATVSRVKAALTFAYGGNEIAIVKSREFLSSKALRAIPVGYGVIYAVWLYILLLLCTSSWVLFKVNWNRFVACAAITFVFFAVCFARPTWRIRQVPLWIPLILVPYFFCIYGPFYWGPAKTDSISAGYIDSFEERLIRDNPQMLNWFYFKPPKAVSCDNQKTPFELRLTVNNQSFRTNLPCFPAILLLRQGSSRNIVNDG